MASRSLLATARIGRTHGLDGFVRVESLSGGYDHLADLDKAEIRTKDGRHLDVEIEDVAERAGSFMMRFKGYESPEKAKFLSGGVMYVTRDRAPALEEGEFYVADLFGLEMILEDGTSVGKVVSVSEGAQSLLLQVDDGNGRIFLVPYMKPFVGDIDFAANTMILMMKELAEA